MCHPAANVALCLACAVSACAIITPVKLSPAPKRLTRLTFLLPEEPHNPWGEAAKLRSTLAKSIGQAGYSVASERTQPHDIAIDLQVSDTSAWDASCEVSIILRSEMTVVDRLNPTNGCPQGVVGSDSFEHHLSKVVVNAITTSPQLAAFVEPERSLQMSNSPAPPDKAQPPADVRPVTAAPAPKSDLRLQVPAKIVVIPLRAVGNMNAQSCELLTGMLLTHLDEVAGLTTVSREDIESMLGVERQKDLLGCSTSACTAEIGGALGADYVLRGEVGHLGNSFNLNFTAVKSKDAVVAVRASKRVAQSEDALADALPGVVAEIVAKLNGTKAP